MLRLFVAAILLCFTATGSSAQNSLLAHLKKVRLNAEVAATAGAADCGITKQLIHDAFMYPASGAKFDVVDSASSAVVDVEVATNRLNGAYGCASAVNLLVYYFQPVTLAFSNATATAPILLWNQGGVYASAPGNHPSQVKDAIEDLTKEFITEWNLSNK